MLSRYEKTSDGNFIIDVSAPKVEALYNDFDKSAPYIRRDLDHDLVDYLIECARELKRESFVLRFTIDQSPNDDKQSRIRKSVNRYFVYLAACEQQRVMQMFRRSVVLLGIGLAILFLSVSVNHGLGTERSVAANVFAEGLTVVAWVALWESLAMFLLEEFPLRKNTALYRRLANAELTFRTGPDAAINP